MSRPSNRLSGLPLGAQRVDSNRLSMACATPQNKPAFGKLNIPKVQSGTSDRRTSFFGSRGSGMPRNSGFGAEKIKDTRPLHDKAYVQQCIRTLCEFLTENGYLGSMTTKTLQSPSTKEFLKVFEFIYCQLDDTFQMPVSKTEEEVPKLLKDLGYPFALSKSSMYSVGAPHTWPMVLGALIWLIDVVKISNCMNGQALLFSDFPEESEAIEESEEFCKLFFDYTSDSYGKFMQGQDAFEDEDEEFLAKQKKLYNVDETLLASKKEEFAILAEQVERLEKESQTDRLMSKRNDKLRIQADLQKLQSYHVELKTFRATLESKISGQTDDLEATGLQVEALKQEQARLQHVLHLQNQKFTNADIERIMREKAELQQTLASLDKSLEEAQQHMWNEEIALAQIIDTREKELADYHKLARQLTLIPATAANAGGHDFEIGGTNSEYGSITHYKTQILNPLSKMIANVEEEGRRLTDLKLSMEEAVEQVNSNISDKANDLRQLREQIRRLDEQLEHGGQEMAREEQKWMAELDSAENHRKLLEDKVSKGYDEAVEELKAAQRKYDLVLHETEEKKRTIANNLASVFCTAANHLSLVEKYMEDQRKRAERSFREVVKSDEDMLKKVQDIRDDYIKKANNC